MQDFILLMHDDGDGSNGDWASYFSRLRASGAFEGGSAIGDGVTMSKGEAPPVTEHLAGYIRVRAADLDAAKALVVGNPVYESNGTVEVRALPRDD